MTQSENWYRLERLREKVNTLFGDFGSPLREGEGMALLKLIEEAQRVDGFTYAFLSQYDRPAPRQEAE